MGGKDLKLNNFNIQCKMCGGVDCRTYRDFYPEMRGECKIVCLNCRSVEFCIKED